MKKFNGLILATSFLIVLTGSANAQTSSVYTNLAGSGCKTVETNEETGGLTQECKGFGKWTLMVLDDDSRMSVNVVTPDKKTFELNFWSVVTSAFSSLGTKAEWRVKKEASGLTPVALIVRVNSSSDASGKTVRQSYLAVTKITGAEICVTDKIADGKNANQLARNAADNSADKSCLQ